MDNFIFYPLLIMLVVGSFYQVYRYDEISLSSSDTVTQELTGNQTLDEVESQIDLENASLSLDFDMTVGLIGIVVSAIALGLIGLNFVGSGLSDRSVKIIWNGIVFYGLWTIFSILAFNPIALIPIFGVLLWFILTMVYSLGVFNRMGE